jgi:carbohydrate-selective porin OprB
MNEFGKGYEGAAQGYSNIDANSRTTLYEFWVEQTLVELGLHVKAGKIGYSSFGYFVLA